MIGYRKSIQFFYSPNNELQKTITIKDTGLQVQRTTTQYHYDAFGRRIAKHSKTEHLNKLNQQGKLVKYPTTLLHLSKTQKTQHQTTLMLWEGNRQIQEYTYQFIFTTVYDQDSFEPVARVVQDRQDTSQIKVYHYHNNHLGTPQELTDENGEVVWLGYDYAWGGSYQSYYKEQSLNNIVIDKDHLQPLKFQGQFFDPETSLHYNRFRYYDSDVGMFIQRDPIGLLGGNNVFAYAPNPILFIDALGLTNCEYKGNGMYVCGGSNNTGTATMPRCATAECAAGIPSLSNPMRPFGHVCGSSDSEGRFWVPDGKYKSACQAHDDCYATCGKTKAECDNEFFKNGAWAYSTALKTIFYSASKEAYEKAQRKSGCTNICTSC